MDDRIDRLMIGVRADTQGFAADVAAMRISLETGLGQGADQAGHRIEAALARALRSGKLGFEDLRAVALSVLDQIARAAILNMTGGAQGGLASIGASLLAAFAGVPGRATGGPVAPGQAYRVGERGPEVFVPTSSGTIAPAPSAAREVRIAITVNAPPATAPAALQQSSRQIARALRAALLSED